MGMLGLRSIVSLLLVVASASQARAVTTDERCEAYQLS